MDEWVFILGGRERKKERGRGREIPPKRMPYLCTEANGCSLSLDERERSHLFSLLLSSLAALWIDHLSLPPSPYFLFTHIYIWFIISRPVCDIFLPVAQSWGKERERESCMHYVALTHKSADPWKRMKKLYARLNQKPFPLSLSHLRVCVCVCVCVLQNNSLICLTHPL